MRNISCVHRIVYLVFFCVLISFVASGAEIVPLDIKDLQKIAQDDVAQSDLSGAVTSYQKIQQTFPNTAYAADAQKQVVLTCLQANQADKTLNALSEFSRKYSLQPDYISHMEEIINRMADANMASQAKDACQSLLDRFPKNPEMLWILQRKSRCEIFMKTPDQAAQTVKLMQQKYASHPQYAEALSWTAYEYRRMGYSAAAAGLYKSLLAQNPSADIQLRCRSGLVLTNLGLGDKENAIKEAQQMKTSIRSYQKYIQTTELEEAINALTDAGQPGTAQEICQAAVEQFTDTPALLWIWQRKARCEVFMHKLDLADESVKVMQQKYATHPEYVDALNWTAYEYRRMGYFARSWEMYDSILAQKPNEVVQLRSLAGLILSDVGLESTAGAAKDAQRLKDSIKSCQNYVRISEVEDAINALVDAGQPDTARGVCQTITVQFPDHPQMLWIWQRQARSEVIMKKFNMTDESVSQMQKFSNHPQYAEALSWTAYECCKAGYYQKAVELSQMALNQKGSLEDQIRSIASQSRAYARLGQEDKTQANIEVLLSQYGKSQPDSMASYLFGIGEEYYLMAEDAAKSGDPNQIKTNYQKALAVWQGYEQANPNHNNPLYPYFSGITSQKLGQYEQAIEYFRQVISKWPGYEKAWFAQYMIALSSEELAKQNKASLDVVKEAYQLLKDKYPDSAAAEVAAQKLGSI